MINSVSCTFGKLFSNIQCFQNLMFYFPGEQKLAQDRTIVVVGIISGILLFIGICVASYFLAQ